MNRYLMRQSDVIPMQALTKKINIIGAGGIGSNLAITLAYMGIQDITLWDFDHVTEENMNNQRFRRKDIGKAKVAALEEIIYEITGNKITARNEKYTGQQLDGIVISALDSMAARKVVWDRVKGSILVDKLIDPRMSLEYGLMYVMDPNNLKDCEAYEKTLYSDDTASQDPCTAKAIMYTTNLISGLVAKAVKNIILKQRYPRNVIWDIANDTLQVWHNDFKKENSNGQVFSEATVRA